MRWFNASGLLVTCVSGALASRFQTPSAEADGMPERVCTIEKW